LYTQAYLRRKVCFTDSLSAQDWLIFTSVTALAEYSLDCNYGHRGIA